MKSYLSSILAVISINLLQAQDISDALRYSQQNITGTARFRSMSGAFGAVGGDLSAINVNPAGAAVFNNNSLAFTISSYNITNESSYFGSDTKANDNTVDLNQAGAIMVFRNDTKDWRKFTIALNYENTNNFDNTVFTAGTNPTNSISNYFLYYANQNGGVPVNTLANSFYEDLDFGQGQAFLGYQGYLINPVTDENGNVTYASNVSGGNYYQQYALVSTGYNGKISVNAATSYKDRLYLGMNLNFHGIDYRQSTAFFEEPQNNPDTGVVQVNNFNNELYTYGTGFSVQLGAIAKITESFRAGLSYQSPTWYVLNDEFTQSLVTERIDAGNIETEIVDPGITLLYDAYELHTPSKVTGSLAYIFGKYGLISVDYTMTDYSNAHFSPEEDFPVANTETENALDTAGELRIGAEHRIKQWSLRAGYRYEESPYKNGRTVGDLMGITGGLGYSFGSTRLDLAYSYSHRHSDPLFFSQGFTDAPRISSVNNNVSLSLSFEL
ncbi:MAG TPA: outer membrane protein transport protein [Flavobacterium sp.]|jgi:hypothetical protein